MQDDEENSWEPKPGEQYSSYAPDKFSNYKSDQEIKIYRSQAWKDLIEVPIKSYDQLMDLLKEVWHGGNPRALRIAFETTCFLEKKPPVWVVNGISRTLKSTFIDKKYTKKLQKELERRNRELERWNAWERAKEEGLQADKAYKFALRLLGRQEMNNASSMKTITNSHSRVNTALKDPIERRKYIVVAMPSPLDNRAEFFDLTLSWL